MLQKIRLTPKREQLELLTNCDLTLLFGSVSVTCGLDVESHTVQQSKGRIITDTHKENYPSEKTLLSTKTPAPASIKLNKYTVYPRVK